MLKLMEEFCFYAGKVIIFIGASGMITTILFDKVARGMTLPIQFGWLQWVGLIIFSLITAYGAFVDTFLNKDVYPMLKKYLNE